MRIGLFSCVAFLLVSAGCTSKYAVVATPGQSSAAQIETSIGAALNALNFVEDRKTLEMQSSLSPYSAVWRENSQVTKEGQLLAFVSYDKGNVTLDLVPQTYGAKTEAEGRSARVAASIESVLRGQGVLVKVCKDRSLDLR